VQTLYSLDHQTLTSPRDGLAMSANGSGLMNGADMGFEAWTNIAGDGEQNNAMRKGGRLLLQSRKSACIRI
jgi:hypothetical protein